MDIRVTHIRVTHILELSAPLMALLTSAAQGATMRPDPSPQPMPDKAPAAPLAAAPAGSADPAPAAAAAEAPAADDGPNGAALDAHGHPWSADLHASTKGMTKEGLWRMKVGATRPDPVPGFTPEGATAGVETAPAADTSSANQVAQPAPEEDDEFAAFRNAAAASDAADTAAAENIPARKWTDADLGALCNQAATKLGDPAPVKALIAEFVKEGAVPHSRNIDDAEREAFAKAVELKAGIEFAG